MPDLQEFYVGYLGLSPRHARFVRVAVPTLLWLLAIVAGLGAWQQRDPGDATWETGATRTWTGVLRATPYPMLETDNGTFLLVRQGKHGAQPDLANLDGRQASVEGWRLQRDGRRMIELAPDNAIIAPAEPVDTSPTTHPAPDPIPLGSATLRGEIMDAKCYLGAMKPGEGKAHKPCATLCIDAGIPPVLVTRDADGRASYYLLTTPDGGPANALVHAHIGEPVEVRGPLTRRGDVLLLAVESVEFLR